MASTEKKMTFADYVGMTGVALALGAVVLAAGQIAWGVIQFYGHRLWGGDLGALTPLTFVVGLSLAAVGLILASLTKKKAD